MPPKVKKDVGKKQQKEKQQKVIEDRTFGLKNKKGAKAQKFIQQVQKSVQNQGKKTENDAKKRKEQKEKELKELNEIFKPVISKQKLEVGVDPKSVLCVFFKVGQCSKGDKCKFSHDLQVEKKSAKKDIYTDSRDAQGNKEDDAEELTAEQIKSFHICNHFLEAVENNKYGWFWNCPNGDNCKYKHALPRGYKLKKDQVIVEDKREQTLEELLALDKAKYTEFDPSKLEGTPVTVERFLEWKAKFKKEMEKIKPQEKKNDKKQTGKEMFTFNPDMEAEGETDGGVSIYDIIDNKNKERKEKEESLEVENSEDNEDKNVEIDEDLFDNEDIDLLDDELNNLTVNR